MFIVKIKLKDGILKEIRNYVDNKINENAGSEMMIKNVSDHKLLEKLKIQYMKSENMNMNMNVNVSNSKIQSDKNINMIEDVVYDRKSVENIIGQFNK